MARREYGRRMGYGQQLSTDMQRIVERSISGSAQVCSRRMVDADLWSKIWESGFSQMQNRLAAITYSRSLP